MIRLTVILLTLLAPALAHADFFRDLKRAVQNTAEQTVILVASDMVRDMIIDATSTQTSSEAEVAVEYEEENGSLPSTMTVSSYRSLILPGDAVKPGTKVRVKSYIEVIPGQDGRLAKIEEKLTIWDNEDNSESLKTMMKEAGDTGGIYEGEFAFSLPEGMPQGVYPITTELLMDGEWVRDEKHNLQLVMVTLPSGEMLASIEPR